MTTAKRAAGTCRAVAGIPGRAAHGRPGRITARAAIAAAAAAAAAIWAAGTPAAPAIEAAAALWWAVTSHPELAPPRQQERR